MCKHVLSNFCASLFQVRMFENKNQFCFPDMVFAASAEDGLNEPNRCVATSTLSGVLKKWNNLCLKCSLILGIMQAFPIQRGKLKYFVLKLHVSQCVLLCTKCDLY